MTKQVINLGTGANSNNGDPLRTAFTKVNANFEELYTLVGSASGNVTDVTGPAFNHNRHNNITVTVDSNTDQIILDATLSSIVKDINGSVFADDSTLLVDAVDGKIPSANLQGTEVNNWNTAYGWGDHSQAGYLTTPLQININGDDSATTVIGNNGTIQFKGDSNITSTTDQSGTITYTLNSEISADLTGSVFADSSTMLINGTNGTIQADHLVGTLPAIDGSNLTNMPYISLATLQTELAASADFADFQTRIAAL